MPLSPLSLSPDHLLQPLVMAFHHRKLINETLVAACEPYCDINTKNATCPTICLDFCPPGVCKSYLTLPPPPPLPSPPPPVSVSIDPEKSQKLSFLLTASLAILATAFFLFTCYIIYKFYTVWSSSRRRRVSLRRQSDGGPDDGPDDDSLDEDYGPVVDHPIWYIRTIGLQPSVINAITIVKYKRADGVVEGSDCAVCLNEFQEDETLRLLPKCNHAFHIPCIDTWLGSHTNCPMCRAPIINNSPDPSPQDSAVHDSGRVEEAGLEIEGSARRETRVRIEDDRTSRSQIGIEIDENLDSKVDLSGLDSIQPVRRSVSMDSISALAISAAVANAIPLQSDRSSNNEMVRAKESVVNQGLARLVGSPLIERSMQSGSSSIKRSASCSAKVYLSRHSSRSRN